MANGFNGLLSKVAPGVALAREEKQAKLDLLQAQRGKFLASTYAPVGGGRRTKEFYRNSRDASGAMQGARLPLAYIGRDMFRNNPRVARANNLIAGYTISSGIRPVVTMKDDAPEQKALIEGLIRDHLETTAIDADGHSTIYGLQRLAMVSVPTSGEVLVRRRLRRASDDLPLPFQIQMLEADFIADEKQTYGNGLRRIESGIEYGVTGRPEAYHLHSEHPGSIYGGGQVRRVEAKNIAHVFQLDRPGQRRGVSWYAPVMAELHDIHKFMQGTLKRQEVAAMFAGILKTGGDNDPDDDTSRAMDELQAGTIFELEAGTELDFTDPPGAQNAEPIVRLIDRAIASGLMLTYEGFSGDYSQVNYTSGRMGRMDQDPIVRFWQNELMVARTLGPVTRWFKEAIDLKMGIDPARYTIDWTPPRRAVVDPTKDFPALIKKIRGGLGSRQAAIRELGDDPDRVRREILEDAQRDDADDLVFDSDARRVSVSGVGQAKGADSATDDPENKSEDGNDE